MARRKKKDNQGSLDYGFGVLNPIEDPNVYDEYDSTTTSGVTVLKNLTEKNYTTNTIKNIDGYKAVCLRVDLPTESNSAGSWISQFFSFLLVTEPQILLSVRARIPEIHASLPDPFIKCPDGFKVDQKIVDMHPAFIAINSDLSNDVPAPGDIVQVDFANRENMSGPQYKAKILSRPILLSQRDTTKSIMTKTSTKLQTNTEEVAKKSTNPSPTTEPEEQLKYHELPYEEKIEGLDPELQEKVPQILQALEKRGFRLFLYSGHRTEKEQQELKAKGHTTVSFSFHNAYKDGKKNSYAADILDKDFMGEFGGKWAPLRSPKRKAFWTALGEEAEKRGLVWGGRWKFYDPGHIQNVPNSFLAQAKRETRKTEDVA